MLRWTFPVLMMGVLSQGFVPSCDDPGTPTPAPGACMATGCSGQICASEPMASTCEWTCEYGCYQYATCEPQALGACGWTTTPEYDACVRDCANQPM